MKCVFDSTVLVAAFIQNHPKHLPSLEWLKKAKRKEAEFYIAAHSLLEIYHVLTSAPFKPKIKPKAASKLIQVNIRKNTQTIILKSEDYFKIIDNASIKGLSGGIIYDMLIWECAREIKAHKFITLNSKDFYRIKTDEDDIKIVTV